MMPRYKQALLGITGVAAPAIVAATVPPAQAENRAPNYSSSIRLGAEHRRGETKEAARYADLATIDLGQAIAAAKARVPAKVLSAALDNENGNLVYSVLVRPAQAGESLQDIKVDAGNGMVLKVDSGEDEDDGEDEKAN